MADRLALAPADYMKCFSLTLIKRRYLEVDLVNSMTRIDHKERSEYP